MVIAVDSLSQVGGESGKVVLDFEKGSPSRYYDFPFLHN
jgi:hypothetical protein